MNKDGKIGIFDSGIGGVTVLKEIIKLLPNEDYIYYSDSKHNPYGNKTDEEIIEYCEKIVQYFLNNNCKIIVIACNTASAKAAKELRKNYQNIPIIAIEPAYKMVYDYAYNKKTLIMATQGTIESDKFNLLFHKYDNHKTELLACVGLAEIIEEGNKEKIIQYLKDNISKYKGEIENVVLGCTHYPLVKDEIEEVIGNVNFFDGAVNVAKHLVDILKEKDLLAENNGQIEFIDSSNLKEKEKRFFNILKNK